jgi:hypothetical protein
VLRRVWRFALQIQFHFARQLSGRACVSDKLPPLVGGFALPDFSGVFGDAMLVGNDVATGLPPRHPSANKHSLAASHDRACYFVRRITRPVRELDLSHVLPRFPLRQDRRDLQEKMGGAVAEGWPAGNGRCDVAQDTTYRVRLLRRWRAKCRRLFSFVCKRAFCGQVGEAGTIRSGRAKVLPVGVRASCKGCCANRLSLLRPSSKE